MTVFGSVCGALLGIVVGGATGNPLGGLLVGLTAGLSSGLMYALSFGLIFVLIRTIHGAGRQAGDEVRTTETVRWNWTGARKSGCRGLMLAFALAGGFGLVFAFIFMLVFGSSGALIPVLVGGLVIGLVFGLIFGVVVGLAFGLVGSFEQRVEDMKTKPNQGIRLSIRNALFAGGGAGLILGSAVWFLAAPFYGLFYGIFAALSVALWFGGLDVLKHGTLRTLLYVRGDAPLNYARFLDYAADELNFLQKVGGGYMFVHRYLLEYFANEHAGGELR